MKVTELRQIDVFIRRWKAGDINDKAPPEI
jgi:hypothetical protein